MAIVAERISAHCGPGCLLRTILRVGCPACGVANEMALSAADILPDATATCEQCKANFRLGGQSADEAIVVGGEFRDYLRLVAGKSSECKTNG